MWVLDAPEAAHMHLPVSCMAPNELKILAARSRGKTGVGATAEKRGGSTAGRWAPDTYRNHNQGE